MQIGEGADLVGWVGSFALSILLVVQDGRNRRSALRCAASFSVSFPLSLLSSLPGSAPLCPLPLSSLLLLCLSSHQTHQTENDFVKRVKMA